MMIWSVLMQAAEALRLCAMECLLHKHAGHLHLSRQPNAALSHGFTLCNPLARKRSICSAYKSPAWTAMPKSDST